LIEHSRNTIVPKRRYWPFDTTADDQPSAEDRRNFGFLDSAFRSGYKSFDVEGMLLGASAMSGREGEMIRRGGKGRYWEIVLSETGEKVESAFVDGFDAASDAVLSWLSGDSCLAVMAKIGHAIVTKPGERGW
jgi:hypothetical protein